MLLDLTPRLTFCALHYFSRSRPAHHSHHRPGRPPKRSPVGDMISSASESPTREDSRTRSPSPVGVYESGAGLASSHTRNIADTSAIIGNRPNSRESQHSNNTNSSINGNSSSTSNNNFSGSLIGNLAGATGNSATPLNGHQASNLTGVKAANQTLDFFSSLSQAAAAAAAAATVTQGAATTGNVNPGSGQSHFDELASRGVSSPFGADVGGPQNPLSALLDPSFFASKLAQQSHLLGPNNGSLGQLISSAGALMPRQTISPPSNLASAPNIPSSASSNSSASSTVANQRSQYQSSTRHRDAMSQATPVTTNSCSGSTVGPNITSSSNNNATNENAGGNPLSQLGALSSHPALAAAATNIYLNSPNLLNDGK